MLAQGDPSPLEEKNTCNRARAGMRKEKRKEGKDPEGGSKKSKEVANDKPLASMFEKQQAVTVVVS